MVNTRFLRLFDELILTSVIQSHVPHRTIVKVVLFFSNTFASLELNPIKYHDDFQPKNIETTLIIF